MAREKISAFVLSLMGEYFKIVEKRLELEVSHAKVMSKKSGSCLTTQHQKYRVCLYNKTIIPFTLVVYELIMSSYTTRAHGIIVKYVYIYYYFYFCLFCLFNVRLHTEMMLFWSDPWIVFIEDFKLWKSCCQNWGC